MEKIYLQNYFKGESNYNDRKSSFNRKYKIKKYVKRVKKSDHSRA